MLEGKSRWSNRIYSQYGLELHYHFHDDERVVILGDSKSPALALQPVTAATFFQVANVDNGMIQC